MTVHKNRVYDYGNNAYHCRFCDKRWDADDAEPECITGYEKVMLLLDKLETKPDGRKTKHGGSG